MTARDDLVTEAAQSTLDLVAAAHAARAAEADAKQQRARMVELRRRRDQAMWLLYHEFGMSAPQIEAALGSALRGRGLSEGEVVRVGVSHDTVRRIVGSRVCPTTPPEGVAG